MCFCTPNIRTPVCPKCVDYLHRANKDLQDDMQKLMESLAIMRVQRDNLRAELQQLQGKLSRGKLGQVVLELRFMEAERDMWRAAATNHKNYYDEILNELRLQLTQTRADYKELLEKFNEY